MPFIRTQLIITDIQAVELSENGLSFGQQVDEAISNALHAPSDNSGPPARIHEISFGFETDDEWHSFARKAHEMGAYPETSDSIRARARTNKKGSAVASSNYED